MSNVTVINSQVAYALIGPRFLYTPGAEGVAATDDGGRHWTAIADQLQLQPLADESGMAFSDEQRGWVWRSADPASATAPSSGEQPLLTTDDGGTHWTVVTGISDVENVLPMGADIWVVARPGLSINPNAPEAIWISTTNGSTWSRSPDTPPPFTSLMRVNTSTAYGLGTSGIIATTDAGASWSTVAPRPCVDSPNGPPLFSAGGVGDLWLMCVGEPGAGAAGKQVYRSHDAGLHWTLTASVPIGSSPTVGQISAAGYPQRLTAVSPTLGYLSLDRAGLWETTDGGRTWTSVGQYADVTIYSLTKGGMGSGLFDGTPWRTTDGIHWAPAKG